MKLFAPVIAALIMFLTIAGVTQAAPLKTYVTEFSVSGAPGRDDLKTVLQGVLASRLNPEQVQLVESKDKAELTIAGSYARFGKIFSLDVQIKNMISNSLSRVFEQGEGEDDLLPAVGRLSRKVDRELAKIPVIASKVPVAPAPASSAIAAVVAAPANPSYQLAPENTVKNAPAVAASQESYQIRTEEGAKSNPGSWTSPPVTGVFSALAMGRTLPGGEREIFISGERNIQYYHKGAELKLIAEATIPNPAKILSIDTADLDKDGIPELYVTIYDRETLVSRVYVPKGNSLELVAENLQWFFRGIGQDFKNRVVYAQEMASGGTMAAGVAELVKTGKSFSVKNQLKLPNSGYVYNFNKLGGATGKGYFVVMDENGYLVVSTPAGEEAWKSAIKYGGSENHYKVELADQRRSLVGDYQWTFLEQRIVITPDGTLLVPHNEGLFNIGNSRSYTKYSMYALRWNGSSLQEKWHTRQNQSYLADFAYDADSKELILLEVVQKSDMFSKGKTVISINKVD